MGVRLYMEPKLVAPVLIASWPGIGNIGKLAVDTLRKLLNAEEFGQIEPWDFFYPKKVIIKDGELKNLEFPTSKFYFKRTEGRDLLFFVGEEQSAEVGRDYAEGTTAYRMANLILDVAVKFNCQRIYTSGAAVAPIHHTMRSRVWAVPNSEDLINEVRSYENTVLMSDIEERDGQGSINGLNGLLIGVARQRGLAAICVMGEIPLYLQGFPFSYPKASKSVLEVLMATLGVSVDLAGISAVIEQSEREIERLYERFPSEVREQLDKLKYVTQAKLTETGPITEDDKKMILEDVDKFFKRKPRED